MMRTPDDRRDKPPVIRSQLAGGSGLRVPAHGGSMVRLSACQPQESSKAEKAQPTPIEAFLHLCVMIAGNRGVRSRCLGRLSD